MNQPAENLSPEQVERQKQLQAAMEKTAQHVSELYNLMVPGMGVLLNIPDSPIFVPGRRGGKGGCLFVMRPSVVVNIQGKG